MAPIISGSIAYGDCRDGFGPFVRMYPIMGATESGKKELVAIEDGARANNRG